MPFQKRRTVVSAIAVAASLALGPSIAVAQQKVLKYAHFQPAKEDQPQHKAALLFKEHVEKNTNNAIKVEIYPAGQFGKDAEVMEALKLGTLEMAIPHDGAIATIFKPVAILGIPYLFENHAHAWRVYDSKFGKEFGDLMLQKTGVRMLAIADNGVRHFTNSQRPVKTPADLKGMKIRIQPSPVFKSLVESFGASASAIPWAELPTALQSRVVDGQENGVTNIIAASLYQYQKYVTLDGHVWSIHAYLVNDKFYKGLTPDQQKTIAEATRIARDIHRKMTSEQDLNAKETLTRLGMQVTELSATEIDGFRKIAQPAVRTYVEKEVGKEWVEKLMQSIDANRK